MGKMPPYFVTNYQNDGIVLFLIGGSA